MTERLTILLLEDEPLILMDLEFAAEDHGCKVLATSNCNDALAKIAKETQIDAAVLDVSLSGGDTCSSVATELKRLGIPFVLHSGDLDRHGGLVRRIGAELIAKPASAEKVIAAALNRVPRDGSENESVAAE